MVLTKVSAETVVRNAIAVVAAALLPSAVLGFPASGAMLLPCTLLYSLLFRCALRSFVATLLLSALLPIVLVPPLLLSGALLLPVLVVTLLLLRTLLVLVLPLLLLGMLLLLILFLPLLLLGMLLLLVLVLPLLLLSMLLFRLGLRVLALLLFGMAFLFVLLLLLSICRSSDSEKQRQGRCTDDSNYFHKCFLHYCGFCTLALAQASCCRIDRMADGFAGHKKFNSPVLLPASRVIV